MAEGDGVIFNNAKELLFLGDLHLDSDTLYLSLIHTKTPSIDGAATWNMVSACECAGSGYTAGGSALNGKAVTQDDDDNCAMFDAADVTWTALNLTTPADKTPDFALLWAHITGSPMVARWETATATNGGNYTLQWSASGLMRLT